MLSLRVLFFLVALFIVQCQADSHSIGDDKKVTKQDLIDKWHGIFGEKVNFSRKPVFDCMVYLHPQPMSRLQDFGDKQFARGGVDRSAEWMAKFFKPDYRPDVHKMRPKKYYLPHGREPGLLYYEWKAEGCSLSMSENFNGILLGVKPVRFDAKKGIQNKDLADLLLKMLNLKSISVAEVIKSFQLSETAKNGDLFTNARPLRVSLIRGWRDQIVVFLSKDSICIMCFKANEDRAEVGFRYYGEWLNWGLFEKDGKTLVAPPNRQDHD